MRARLLAGVIALAAVCLAVLGILIFVQQRQFLVQRVDDQAKSAAPAVGRALDEAGVPGGPGPRGPGRAPPGGQTPPRSEGVAGEEHGERGRGPDPSSISLPPGVYGERRDAMGQELGSVVLSYGQAAPSPPKLPARIDLDHVFTVRSTGRSELSYRVKATPTPAEGGATTIVAVPLSGVEEQLDRLLLVEASVIGVVLVLMAGMGWWVIRLGLRPLDRMGETAGAIAAGDLSQRVSPADSKTEVGRLGLSLNAMLHQIERAFAQRSASETRLRRFLADASHELRTPLASIRGYAELYRIGAARDEVQAERAMGRIEQEAARMGVLVEDLLTLARLDEVRDAVREPIDLAELVRDATDDAQATARDREITFRADEAGRADGGNVLGDVDQLRQVVGNLTRNALVHTPTGTSIEVTVARVDDHVRLTIRDHGPGLPDDGGTDIFERFWRTDRARGRGPAGAGLGLAIVCAIVTAHDGEVSGETVTDGGARFTVDLPAHGPAQLARPAATAKPTPSTRA